MLAHPSVLPFLPAVQQTPIANHFTSAPSLTTNSSRIGPSILCPRELRVCPSTAGPSPYIHPDVHQHTHQHTFTPFLDKTPTILPNPASAKITKPESSNLLQPLPQVIPGLSNMEPSSFTPHTGSFSFFQGAFQPKISGVPDMANGHGTVTHVQSQRDPKKPGRWCAMHVRIAWHVHNYKQRAKTSQINANNLPLSMKPDIFTVCDFLEATQNPRNVAPDTCLGPKLESPITLVKYGDLETLNIKDFGGLTKTTPRESSHVESPEPQQSPSAKELGDKDKPESEEWVNTRDGPRHLNIYKEVAKRDIEENYQRFPAAPFYDSPSTNNSFQHTEISEPSNCSYSCRFGGRKREHECEVNVKRAKQDTENGFCEIHQPIQSPKRPCPMSSLILNPFSQPMSVQQMATGSPMPSLYPINNANNVAVTYCSTPVVLSVNQGGEKLPFETPSWGQLGEPVLDRHKSMDLSSQKDLLMRGYSVNGGDASQMLEAQWWYRDAEAYQTFLTSAHVQPPLGLGHQEQWYMREHKLRHSIRENYYRHHCCSQLPFHSTSVGPHPYQPRFLTPTYHLGPTTRLGFPQHSGPLRKIHTFAASLVSTTNSVSH